MYWLLIFLLYPSTLFIVAGLFVAALLFGCFLQYPIASTLIAGLLLWVWYANRPNPLILVIGLPLLLLLFGTGWYETHLYPPLPPTSAACYYLTAFGWEEYTPQYEHGTSSCIVGLREQGIDTDTPTPMDYETCLLLPSAEDRYDCKAQFFTAIATQFADCLNAPISTWHLAASYDRQYCTEHHPARTLVECAALPIEERDMRQTCEDQVRTGSAQQRDKDEKVREEHDLEGYSGQRRRKRIREGLSHI